MTQDAETLVVVLSPEGRSALASILVSGPQATAIVDRLFHSASGRAIAQQPLGRILFGRWLSAASGEELVVCRRDEQNIEVHCHGGSAAVRAIVASLVADGCRALDWRSWIERTERDPIVAAARIQLAAATTERTAGLLWQQARGALRRDLDQLLVSLRAGELDRASQQVASLLELAPLGLHLVEPWQVVLTGPPNVGKSSLINALLGYQRAIVHPQAGTTRDLVTAATAINGWPVELVDTAGLRSGGDALETAGMDLARAKLASADLVLAISDARQPNGDDTLDSKLLRRACLFVRNKCDLLDASESPLQPTPPQHGTLYCSALTGQGIAELQAAIAERLVPGLPAAEQGLPFTPPQVAALQAIHTAIDARDAQQAIACLAVPPLALRD